MASNSSLKSFLLETKQPVFAVIDGAQFEDLPRKLFGGDFVHTPLYLDRGDGNRDRVLTAPQLVWLDRGRDRGSPVNTETRNPPDPDVVERLLELLGLAPAAVFWQCSAGGHALFRHLRTTNMILVPEDTETDYGKPYEISPLQTEGAMEGMSAPSNHVLVLFRHADANVMAQVLPTLNPAQVSRLLGPAEALCFAADPQWNEAGGVMGARRAPNLPERQAGMLKLEQENIRAISVRRDAALTRKVAGYLERVAPDRVSALEEGKLQKFAQYSLRESRRFGVETDAGHCRWAYMSLVTSGQLGQNPSVQEAMRADAPGYSADTRVALLMRHSFLAVKKQASREVD
ncbi:hypothetical protein [Sinorhizobium saheli]|nr:hypothetical protein [Sinorhizobium saheli]MQW87761.1 hypothetical protein [Sinorhizobium saheli]